MISNKTIRLKGVVAEDFCNYKVPSLFLITSFCDWKCCKEANCDISICQNSSLVSGAIKEFDIKKIYDFYIDNPITNAIILGGLEPLLQDEEVFNLISYFREHNCYDTFVIFTGYTEDEVMSNPSWERLTRLGNIIMKYGRYVPNQESHLDEVLSLNLASPNQYAKYYE